PPCSACAFQLVPNVSLSSVCARAGATRREPIAPANTTVDVLRNVRRIILTFLRRKMDFSLRAPVDRLEELGQARRLRVAHEPALLGGRAVGVADRAGLGEIGGDPRLDHVS